MKSVGFRFGALIALTLAMPAAQAMQEMGNDDLGQVVGQALITSNTATNGVYSFYRLNFDAEMDLNMNVNHIGLGCDGAGGTGPCDIELNRLRLAGTSATSSGDSGPPTDFMLQRPYLEFAIKNAGSAATREVVGFRMGALAAKGSMSIGENPNGTTLADDTGITTLSGDMTANVVNATFTNVNVCVGAYVFGVCIGANLNGSATVSSFSQQLVLNRASTIADIGPMTAQASGSLLGLTLNNTHLVNEPLNTIHRIDVQDTSGNPTKDFYISFQKEALNWQKISDGTFGTVTAQKGWWMSIPQVVMANISTNQFVNVGAFAALGGALFNGRVDIQPTDLNQHPVDNCYGTLTFC